MKSLLTGAACIALAVSVGVPASAQMHNNTEKQMTCNDGDNNGDGARHCEIREQNVASIGRLTVDAGHNGGAVIKGWLQGGVLVRARVETHADSNAEAAMTASQVMVDTSAAQVRATGPESAHNASWSVSYEIFVPQNSDLNLKANNGGLTISDVRGEIHFEMNNGGVQLKRVAGDVSGTTVNGGIQVNLEGASWEGRQLEVSTRNGGVTVAMPKSYSAHVQAETESGSIQSDFPVSLDNGSKRSRHVDLNVGAGGPLIHVSTTNGGVRIKHSDTE